MKEVLWPEQAVEVDWEEGSEVIRPAARTDVNRAPVQRQGPAGQVGNNRVVQKILGDGTASLANWLCRTSLGEVTCH
jgi:hypothetical protein